MMATFQLWLENLVLAVLVGVLAWAWWTMPEKQAMAAGGGWDTHGVIAAVTNPAQRLVVIDTNPSVQTICVYRTSGVGEFRLVCARSYRYDLEVLDSADTDIERSNGKTFFEVKRSYEASQRNAATKK
jgi:hypothetical protein